MGQPRPDRDTSSGKMAHHPESRDPTKPTQDDFKAFVGLIQGLVRRANNEEGGLFWGPYGSLRVVDKRGIISPLGLQAFFDLFQQGKPCENGGWHPRMHLETNIEEIQMMLFDLKISPLQYLRQLTTELGKENLDWLTEREPSPPPEPIWGFYETHQMETLSGSPEFLFGGQVEPTRPREFAGPWSHFYPVPDSPLPLPDFNPSAGMDWE